ncbi:replication factor A protein 1 [Medicago truncatula]|uniref:Replication factor-A carboxy-terminal domain protein n=1 Tax=Medicago truncatula TaxID=3880 RepID=G7K1P7_MEDTR|nr:replication factor A protein 1 [Medicago truncatula]AES99245.1 replication factor-A carboxy-terminal domain protein [Medicago truncatula]
MEKLFHSVSEIALGEDGWKIKVRVLRLWEVPSFLKPDQTNSLEMVLIDEMGTKIHASVRKQLFYVFQSKLSEGKVYEMSCFSVAPSVGSYRTTLHPYKIVFQMTTKVQACEGASIPSLGISLCKIADVCQHTSDHDYLVDVLGFMTGISVEREYVRDGKVTKMVIFEITDASGKCECALFGQYVDTLNKLMGKSGGGMPIILVQFAKVKIFRDKASLQNVMNTTRILINPPIEQADQIRKSVTFGSMDVSSVPRIGARSKVSLEEDFLRTFPKKTLEQLHSTFEDGVFVVYATIGGLVDHEDWWYPACKCHRSVSADSGAFYCKGCAKHVFQMVPRFRVKVNVSDATNVGVFVVFDGDMQNLLNTPCSSLVSVAKAENAGHYPPEFEKLKGKKMLFKVEKCTSSSIFFDGSFRVKRVCDDPAIIQSFHFVGGQCTPSKEFTADLPKDVYHLDDEDVVVRSFVHAAFGEGCSRAVASAGESDMRSTSVGVKRKLEGTFVEIDSDDEPLSLRYGKLKQG